jgi:NAD(P)-dependent dehydrogenase (short-subunit alcohol dehydrogenase family)
MDLFSLAGKKAIITGGRSGIGNAVAITLAKAGADIAILDWKEATDTVSTIKKMGRNAFDIITNVSIEDEVDNAFDIVKERFERIDIVFSNAGMSRNDKAEKISFENWRKILSVNLDSMFFVNRAAARIMIADGNGGNIINTASMAGIIVIYPQEQAAYNTAKAGVIHLTKSLACEWAKYNIRVNSISPGYISTDMISKCDKTTMEKWNSMIPLQRLGSVHEITAAVLYLASDASSYTTGTNLVIDGGYSCY